MEARHHVVLAVGLADVLDHLAEVPFLDVLLEVRHVLREVAERHHGPGGDERGILARVDQRDQGGRIARADEEAALLRRVAERDVGQRDLDVRELLDVVEDPPGVLDRNLRPVGPQHGELDRLGGLELHVGRVVVHRADVLGLQVDLVGGIGAAGGQRHGREGGGGHADEPSTGGREGEGAGRRHSRLLIRISAAPGRCSGYGATGAAGLP